MTLRIWLTREDGRSPVDEYDSLLAIMRADQLATSARVSVPGGDATNDPNRGGPIQIQLVTAEAGTALARSLFGWLSVQARTPVRLILTRSGGHTLELAAADWAPRETAMALADFIEAEARASSPADRGDDPGSTTTPDPTVNPDNLHIDTDLTGRRQGNIAIGPGSIQGGPSPVRNTPPGPPFGDEDDDEW